MPNKLDFTTYATYERCEQEGVWRMQRHLLPAGVEASPHFGHVVHVGVRALYDGHSVAEAQVAMKAAWTKGIEPLAVANALRGDTQVCDVCGGVGASGVSAVTLAQWRTNFCACTTPSLSALIDAKKPHLSLWRANAIVVQYAIQWSSYQNDIPTDDANKEAPLTNPLYECVWNEGYAESAQEAALPDRCVRSRADGLLYAMDTKTTSMYISRNWERSFEHNQQVAIQLDTLQATLGERVAGFWLDAIHINKTRAPSADDFSRYGPISYSEALREELRQQRVVQAQRIEYLRAKPEDALKSASACTRYNSLCPYFDLCRADPSERETLVQIAKERGTLREEMWEPSQRV